MPLIVYTTVRSDHVKYTAQNVSTQIKLLKIILLNTKNYGIVDVFVQFYPWYNIWYFLSSGIW